MLGKRQLLLPAIATDPAASGGISLKSGIVIEVNNKKATLLMKDGTFVTVNIPKGKRPLVGKEYQTSYFSYKKRSLFAVPSLSISVAVLIAFVLLSGIVPIGNQSAAAAYVSFDINPSLEVGVDDKMQVVELSAFNQEAKQIIKKHHLSIKNHPAFERFADQLIQAYEKEGYMKSDHSMLITTVKSDDKSKETEAELDLAVNSIVKKAAVKYPVAITVTEANTDTRKKAAQLGVSSGKFTIFQKVNKPSKPIQKAAIREANIQDLQKKMTPSSKDIKVIPHPRQMDTPALDHPDKRDNHAKTMSKEYHVKKEMNRKPQMTEPKPQANERSSSVNQQNHYNKKADHKDKKTPQNRREQSWKNQRDKHSFHNNGQHNNGKQDNREHKNEDHSKHNH